MKLKLAMRSRKRRAARNPKGLFQGIIPRDGLKSQFSSPTCTSDPKFSSLSVQRPRPALLSSPVTASSLSAVTNQDALSAPFARNRPKSAPVLRQTHSWSQPLRPPRPPTAGELRALEKRKTAPRLSVVGCVLSLALRSPLKTPEPMFWSASSHVSTVITQDISSPTTVTPEATTRRESSDVEGLAVSEIIEWPPLGTSPSPRLRIVELPSGVLRNVISRISQPAAVVLAKASMDVRQSVWRCEWEGLQQQIKVTNAQLNDLLTQFEDSATASECTAKALQKDVERTKTRLLESTAEMELRDLQELMALTKPPRPLAVIAQLVCMALNERAEKDNEDEWWRLFRSSPRALLDRLHDCWVSVHLCGYLLLTLGVGQIFADLTEARVEAIRSQLGELQGPDHTAKCSATGQCLHQWLLVLVREWDAIGGAAVQPALSTLCDLRKLQSAADRLGQVVFVEASSLSRLQLPDLEVEGDDGVMPRSAW